jgi:hypothetical protein
MRLRTGLAGMAIVFGCLWGGAWASDDDPTGVRVGTERNYSVEELPEGAGDFGEGGSGEASTQSDTTTQRGIGGFGSGN